MTPIDIYNYKITARLKDQGQLPIGRRLETGARQFVFDCTELAEKFGEGIAYIYARRSEEYEPYLVTSTWMEGNLLYWSPDSYDTYMSGRGLAEIRWVISGSENSVRSVIYHTVVYEGAEESLGSDKLPKSWLDKAASAYTQVVKTVEEAEAYINDRLLRILKYEAWGRNTVYTFNDLVLRKGIVYYCINEHTSSAETDPSVNTSESRSYWEKWFQIGMDDEHVLGLIGDASITDEQISSVIAAYLAEHPIEGVTIDRSLTVRGAAADAQAVGDALDDLNDQVANKLDAPTDKTLTRLGMAADAKAVGDALANVDVPEDVPSITGDYSATTTYNKNDIVYVDGVYYICLADDTTGKAPEDNLDTYWRSFGAPVDDTLSIEGKAADAKAVGDAIPTKLPNPYSLTINGVAYDGSEAINITISSSDSGGGSSDDTPTYATIYEGKALTRNGKAELQDDEDCFVTDFIPVEQGVNYRWRYGTLEYSEGVLSEFDADGNWLTFWHAQGEAGGMKARDFKLYNSSTTQIRATFRLSDKDTAHVTNLDTGEVIWQYNIGGGGDDDDDTTSKNLAINAPKHPQMIGHGYGGQGIANAMSHFKWWVETKGLTFIEADVVRTSDDVAVLSHAYSNYTVYDSLDTAHTINIADLTYAELSAYTWTPSTHATYPSEPIVTAKELMVYARRKNVNVWFDIQDGTTEIVSDLIDYATELGIHKNVFFGKYASGGNWAPEVTGVTAINSAYNSYKTNANQIICSYANSRGGTADDIAEMAKTAHSLGMYFATWTITSESDVDKYFNNGCDFMIVNEFDNSYV